MVTTSESQDQILDAVLSVMMRDGVRGASMRTVAKEADVSLGLLSYHFDGKDALITAAFELATTRLLDRSTEATEGISDPDQRVSAYLRGSFEPDFLDDEYLKLRMSLWAVARTDEALAEVERDYHRRYAAQLQELIAKARPNLPSDEVAGRTTDLIAFSSGLWLNWSRFHDHDDLRRGLDRCDQIALSP